jgi:ParB family transcriptional regulator, chromosome partitioning protein
MAKTRQALGKGLNALLARRDSPDTVVTAAGRDEGASESITRIPVDRIRSNPFQPRLDFDPVALDELKQSILQKGVIQPITVRRAEEGFYELISGERRLRAATDAGFRDVPAYIIEVASNEEMLELALIENLQREHLNPIEIAISYQRLISEVRYTQEDVARKIGKDRTTVTNFIRLLKLPVAVQDSLRKGELNMGHARALLGISDEKIQLKLWKKIVRQGLSVRKVEQLVKSEGDPKKTRLKTSAREGERATDIETRLRRTFGTKVSVKTRRDGSGDITIEFYSVDDLDRLLELTDIIDQYNR